MEHAWTLRLESAHDFYAVTESHARMYVLHAKLEKFLIQVAGTACEQLSRALINELKLISVLLLQLRHQEEGRGRACGQGQQIERGASY